MKQIFALIIALVFMHYPSNAVSFRGLPYYVKIKSVDFVTNAATPTNTVNVCYQFASTIPILDYSDVASQLLRGMQVTHRPATNPRNGDGQVKGIRFSFRVLNFDFDTYLNSSAFDVALRELSFINSAVRTFAGVSKPLVIKSSALSYNSMTAPQYEWVNFCEEIPFGKAFSETYVRRLFRGPGPVGSFGGAAQFTFTLKPPPFLFGPLTISFNRSAYVVPVFGTNELTAGDLQMISLSHFINSLNAIKDNVDESILNEFLRAHESTLAEFRRRYNIDIQLPVDVETLVRIIHRVAGIENPDALSGN